MQRVDPETADASRIRRLTDRVRWFERYRRWVAIAIAAVIAPILISQLGDVLGTSWPMFHSVTMAVMLGVAVWWVAEVIFAWLMALWETECDDLSRSRGLPRAELIQRRK